MRHLITSKTLIFAATALITLSVSAPVPAQERLLKGAPAALTTLPTPGAVLREDANLVITDVMVDKTADNAVAAREQAMTEARRLAFQKLAERHLTPAAYATFRMPDDRTIATLVQDFEIKGEQLSAKRYVAKFTVRFSERVRNYINVPYAPREVVVPQPGWRQMPADQLGEQTAEGGLVIGGEAGADMPATQTAGGTAQGVVTGASVPAAAQAATPRVAAPVLLLPYYENMAGRTILWEDPNPWRDAWQRMPAQASGVSQQLINKIVVPLGDISDISAGNADAVWSGDYKTLEKLRANYRVSEVVLAVANKSGPQMTIDLYFYSGGVLKRRNALTPYVGEKTEHEAWQQGMYDVLNYLQRPAPGGPNTAEAISRSLTQSAGAQPPAQPQGRPSLITTGAPAYPNNASVTAYDQNAADNPAAPYNPVAAAAGAQDIEALLNFSDFNAWLNVQKRFSSMSPPVRIDLRSLSRNTARFTIRYSGGAATLQNALAAQGIAMTPSREVTTASGAPVYDLRVLQ